MHVYEKASRQVLNKDETSIFFSSNTGENIKRDILWEAGTRVCGSYEKYLDLPAVVGKSRVNTFRNIKERIWQKINNWKKKFLTQVGREVLIKTV